jgi:hypothetical protein
MRALADMGLGGFQSSLSARPLNWSSEVFRLSGIRASTVLFPRLADSAESAVKRLCPVPAINVVEFIDFIIRDYSDVLKGA